jgi:transcription termination/antitermination protein NusA
MLVALGENDVKSLDDFAGCAADDLVGWSERKNGGTKRFDGILKDFEVSRADADAMIIQARLAAGWITEDDIAAEEGAEEAVEEGAEQA